MPEGSASHRNRATHQLMRAGFRGLHDANGFFEGFGRRLPGGLTVYAVTPSGEPAVEPPFLLRLPRLSDIREGSGLREIVERGGDAALADISRIVSLWTQRQLSSGHPNPYHMIFYQLRSHRLVEEPRSKKDFLHQAERALMLSGTLLDSNESETGRIFMSGCSAVASRCLRADTSKLDAYAIIALLAQIARHFLLAASEPGLPSLESVRRQAAAEMLLQIAENGKKIHE